MPQIKRCFLLFEQVKKKKKKKGKPGSDLKNRMEKGKV